MQSRSVVSVNQLYGSSKVVKYLNYVPNSKNDQCTFVLNILLQPICYLHCYCCQAAKQGGQGREDLRQFLQNVKTMFFQYLLQFTSGAQKAAKIINSFFQIENNTLLYQSTKLYITFACKNVQNQFRVSDIKNFSLFNKQKIRATLKEILAVIWGQK